MKLAIAQINCVLGDLTGNTAKILQHAEQARQQGAQLLITPVLSLCGYPPEDLLLRDGRVSLTYLKNLLPNYSVFDEKRYFDRGSEPCVFEIENIRFALNICADIWEPDTARQASDAGAQVLLVLNASPYAMRKQESRHRAIRERIAETGMAVIYANMVGGQDELIFDGGSFAMDRHG